MLLVIDVGNTHTVCGVFDGSSLRAHWRIGSSLQRTEDETMAQLRVLLEHAHIDPGKISGIGISSVVPDLTDVFATMSEKYFRCSPMIVGAHLDLGIRIHYKDPRSVGADRLCNAIAGFARHGGPLIIVDFGTATTYDVVGRTGDYLGGVISPGPETAAADLHRRAAKLPKIELHFPQEIIGSDTVTSMQVGIMYGAIDALDGMLRRLQKEIREREGGEAKVIATGGFSAFLGKHSELVAAVEPTLVLEGIRLIYERVHRV